MGLSQNEVRKLIDDAYDNNQWKEISYRSTRETSGKITPPLTAFESKWTLKDKIKPDLEPGQKRRPNGSIKIVEMDVRCTFYRHEVNAKSEKERRAIKKEQLEVALQEFSLKLNQETIGNLTTVKQN